MDRALRRSMLRRLASLQYWIIERRSAQVTVSQFPSKLHHTVPDWVQPGALFHMRIALDRRKRQQLLTSPPLAKALIESAKFYHRRQRWCVTVFMLMPDHIHALLSFERDCSMSRVIGDWKHYQTVQHGIAWQEGYFDHRLRDDERGEQLSAKISYIRHNPVVAGLCAGVEDWPWWIERSALDAEMLAGNNIARGAHDPPD